MPTTPRRGTFLYPGSRDRRRGEGCWSQIESEVGGRSEISVTVCVVLGVDVRHRGPGGGVVVGVVLGAAELVRRLMDDRPGHLVGLGEFPEVAVDSPRGLGRAMIAYQPSAP